MKHKTETSAGGIVYKIADGKTLWLITQHSQHKGWGFPKGLIADVDKNETMEDAALREVREEGGITARIMNHDPIETAYKYKFGDTLVDKKVYYYLMEYVSGDPEDHDWEVSEAKFVSEAEVMNTLSFKADKEAFTKILHFIDN
jgi:8-oxo-dGTP pyrophosphatase MutT (NUDIX family)